MKKLRRITLVVEETRQVDNRNRTMRFIAGRAEATKEKSAPNGFLQQQK